MCYYCHFNSRKLKKEIYKSFFTKSTQSICEYRLKKILERFEKEKKFFTEIILYLKELEIDSYTHITTDEEDEEWLEPNKPSDPPTEKELKNN